MQTNTIIHIAGTPHSVERSLKLGADLYRVAGVSPEQEYLLLELPDERDIPVAVSDQIIINGSERFSVAIGPYPADDNPCLRKPITPVMNEQPLSPHSGLPRPKLTYEQLAALDPDFVQGDGVFVELQDVPDAQVTPGMRVLVQSDDRFYTSPCGNVGFDARLDTELATLRQRHFAVERVDEGARTLVIIRGMALPSHWSRASTDFLVQVPQGYPLAAMDMFWVSPPGLTLGNGRIPQNADQSETYAGQAWQRFSWHYPQGYQWNPETDGLLTHVRFARVRLGQAS